MLLQSMLVRGLAGLFVLAFAGCVGDSGGSAKVSFDGTGNGFHDDRADCDSDGTLVSSGQVDSGQVDVRVTDDGGTTIFTRQFDGGANLDAQALDGTGGTWTLSATRTSDTILGEAFSGDYSFRLGC